MYDRLYGEFDHVMVPSTVWVRARAQMWLVLHHKQFIEEAYRCWDQVLYDRLYGEFDHVMVPSTVWVRARAPHTHVKMWLVLRKRNMRRWIIR